MPSLVLPVRVSLALLLLVATLVAGCDATETSLYNPDAAGNAAPVVESVSPSGVVLAGIDEITISGRNFSATPGDNVVTFDDGLGASAAATVVEASTTSLRVRVPNLPNAALRLRVSVLGAPDFSAPFALPLASATGPFGNLDVGSGEAVSGITSTHTGALLASLSVGASTLGIYIFSGDVPRELYFSTTAPYSDLAVAADGQLYGVRRVRALFRLPKGGMQQTFATLPNGVTLSAVAAAPNGDLWTGGSNSVAANASIYRVTSTSTSTTGTSTAYPFTETVRDLVISGGSLFIASTGDAGSRVWRYALNADGTLGSGAVYVDVSGMLGAAVTVNALAVAQDGTLFVGTNAADPVLEVAPGGAASTLFPGVLKPPVSSFAWAAGSKLYVSQERIGETVSTAAIPARLYLLETRRAGPN